MARLHRVNRDADYAWWTNTHSSIDCESGGGGGQVPHYTEDTKAAQADQQSTARHRRRSTNHEAKSQLIRDGHESVARGSVAHAARAHYGYRHHQAPWPSCGSIELTRGGLSRARLH